MKHRKYFRSYSEAMKKLNLVASEMNRLFENDEEIPLIGEQKKKFVLKGPKKEVPAPEPAADLPPAPMDTPPAPMDTPPAPAADPMASTDDETPTDDMAIPPSDDMGMGDDTDMGGEDLPSDDMDMGGDEDLPAADGDDEEEEGDEEPMGLKSIQKLTGKLSQKSKVLGAFDKAQTVKEAKLVFETISENLATATKSVVKENLGRASKPAGVARKQPIMEVDSQVSRWQKLAGIK